MGESSDAESLHSEVALANCGIHERDCGLKVLVISFSRREPRHGEAFVPVQSAMLAHRAVEYWHPDRKPNTHERQRLLIVALAQCHGAVLTDNQTVELEQWQPLRSLQESGRTEVTYRTQSRRVQITHGLCHDRKQ